MSKNGQGSLGYQMMKALQGIFRTGASRHNAKRYHRDAQLITGISTMRCMSADVHQFARFIRINWPEVKQLLDVRQSMAIAISKSWEIERGRVVESPAFALHYASSISPAARLASFHQMHYHCCPTRTRADREAFIQNRSPSPTPKMKPGRS
jgi:hypothetical protein